MLDKKNTLLSSLMCFLLLASTVFPEEEGGVTNDSYRTITAIGTLSSPLKSTLGSVVSGRVDEVKVEVSDCVKKGDTLLTLDQTFFEIAVSEAKTAVSSATIEIEDAKHNFERMKNLFEKPEGQTPSISQKRFEDARLRYDQAKTALVRAEEALKRAQKNFDETTIKAPYDGVITKRFVHPGEPANATPVTKLLEIESVDSLYVEFSIPQIHMSSVKIGTPVVMAIEGTEVHDVTASIHSIFPDIDEKTRSIKCRAILQNKDHTLHPGSLVRIVIPVEEAHSVSL